MNKKYTEAEYREAAEIWREKNPDKKTIQKRTIIEIKSGKEIPLGTRFYYMRQRLENLTEEQKEYWKDFGLFEEKIEKYTEEEYREAAQIWKEQNPNKKAIQQTTMIVIKSGKEIPLGTRFNTMRSCPKKLTEEQKEYWKNFGLFEEKIEKYTETEYREAAEIWREENPNKKTIPRTTTIVIKSGKEISLGTRFNNMRSCPKKLTEEQKEYWKNFGLFEEKIEKYTEEEYREAAQIWKKQNPNKKTIPSKEVIVIESGKEIPLGKRFRNIRHNPEKLTKEQKEYWKDFGLFEEKREYKKQPKIIKKVKMNVESILKYFNMDIQYLIKCLEKTKKQKNQESSSLEYKGKTLKQFCLENDYDYKYVKRAVELHRIFKDDSFEQLINRSIITYKENGEKELTNWIYATYGGEILNYILLYLNLEPASVVKNMSKKIIDLEEGIQQEIFQRNHGAEENSWLEELYNYLIESTTKNKDQQLNEVFAKLPQEYKLNKKESQILWNAFNKYIETMKVYKIIDVGLETNLKRKIEKIKIYNLDAEDIEESFFIPLEFDEKVLIGRQNELYKRRQLLRQYIIDWDYYTEEEKILIIQENKISKEELYYINNTRSQINQTIEKTKKYSL